VKSYLQDENQTTVRIKISRAGLVGSGGLGLGLELIIGLFFVAYQNRPGRCLVCKHGSHVINIRQADWSSVKNKQ